MIYVVYFSNLGAPAEGLTPAIDIYIKASDGTSAGAAPVVTELSGGFYKFMADPSESLLIRVDAGVTLADPDRYKVMQVTLNDDSLDQSLSTTESNIRGADGDTLETLSDQVDLAALEATLTAMKGAGWTNETLKAIKDLLDALFPVGANAYFRRR